MPSLMLSHESTRIDLSPLGRMLGGEGQAEEAAME